MTAAPPPYIEQPHRALRDHGPDWRRPFSFVVLAVAALLCVILMYHIDARYELYAEICGSLQRSPLYEVDYVYLVKGWMVSTACAAGWLLVSSLCVAWSSSPQDRLEVPLVLAVILMLPLCMFQALAGLFRPENGACFVADGRFRLWMALGLLPHFTLVTALVISFCASVFLTLKQYFKE